MRERAGLFDVSHMGQIHLSGATAIASAERLLLTCPVASLRVGAVRYGMLCNTDGGVRDDVTLYRIAEDEVLLCVNAANVDSDRSWIEQHAAAAAVEDRSEQTGLLALQGPVAARLLALVGNSEAASIRRFRFVASRVAGKRALRFQHRLHGLSGLRALSGGGPDASRLLGAAGGRKRPGRAACGAGLRATRCGSKQHSPSTP